MKTSVTLYPDGGYQQRALSVQQLQKLFGSLSLIVFATNIDGKFIYVNQNSEQVLGYQPGELIGRPLLDVVEKEHREQVEICQQQVIRGIEVENLEVPLQRKDGYTFRASWTLQWDAADKLFYGTMQDITAQKAKASLQELQKQRLCAKNFQMDEMLERITDGFYSLDKEWRITYANAQAEQLLCVKREDYIGRIIWECFPQLIGTIYEEQFQKAMLEKQPVHFKSFLEIFNSWYEVHVYPSDTGLSVFFQDISKEIQHESVCEELDKKVEHHKEQLISVLERVRDGFLTLDANWVITYWNQQAEVIMKKSRSEALGKNVWEVFPFLVGGRFQMECFHAIEQQVPVQFISYEASHDMWFDDRIYPSSNGLSIFFQNITEQKKAEEELKISNERFRLAAKSSAVYDWNLLTDELSWGEGLFDLLGYHSHELQMAEWEAFLHPDERQTVVLDLQTVLKDQGATSWEVEYQILRKDNTYCFVLEKSQIVRDSEGKAVRMVGFLQNVSERKRAEKKLHELSLIAQRTDNLVIITDAEGKITWVNDAFTRISGFSLAEIAGRKPGHFLQGAESDAKVIQLMRSKIAKGEPFTVETINYTKDKKKFWVENHCQPVRDENGKLIQFFAIQTNITERKKLEAKLQAQQKRTNAAVIAAQEQERTLVSQELHDNVNQVLTTVKLYTELCRDGIGNTPEIMNKSIKLLQESIDEIRSLSRRLSAPSLGNIKLKESVKDLVDSVMATNKVSVYFDGFSIEGVEVKHEVHLCVYRIIQEHLTNILKHADAQEVHILMRVVKGELLLQIDDDGRGFDTGKKREGIGITNMITRTESLKGTLSIISSPGLGCQLMASLPL